MANDTWHPYSTHLLKKVEMTEENNRQHYDSPPIEYPNYVPEHYIQPSAEYADSRNPEVYDPMYTY